MVKGWKIDKQIPIAVILTIFLHLSGTIWAAAKFSSRVEVLERDVAKNQSDDDRRDDRITGLNDISYKFDKRLSLVENDVSSIKGRVR